jgi:uncharacterized glyoxalase superfamily protein PhnB
MKPNRSMPRATVIPELGYPDVTAAADWLTRAFGFTVRLRIANHRIQMNVGDGAIVLVQASHAADHAHAVMVRVPDVTLHHEQAAVSGAKIFRSPTDYPYGERQYTVEDPAGHRWTFSQSIDDVAPERWGGTSGEL